MKMILIALALVAGTSAFGQTNLLATNQVSRLKDTNSITINSGKVYKSVKITSVDPDGLMIEYRPDDGGIGISKIKFRDLPAEEQKQYGFDPQAAKTFEKTKYENQILWAARELNMEDNARVIRYNQAVAEEKAARESERMWNERIKAEAASRAADAAMFQALNPPQTTIINQNQNIIY